MMLGQEAVSTRIVKNNDNKGACRKMKHVPKPKKKTLLVVASSTNFFQNCVGKDNDWGTNLETRQRNGLGKNTKKGDGQNETGVRTKLPTKPLKTLKQVVKKASDLGRNLISKVATLDGIKPGDVKAKKVTKPKRTGKTTKKNEVKGKAVQQNTTNFLDVAFINYDFEDVDYIEEDVSVIEEEYIEDNLKHLFTRERTFPTRSKTVNREDRSVLVNWIIEVCKEMCYSQETLFLSVAFFDRFLDHYFVPKREIRLVGVASTMVASKYHETRQAAMRVKECVYVTGDVYTRKQVCEVEERLLKVLQFDLGVPTVATFLNIMCARNKMPGKEKCFARYVAELSLHCGEARKFLPSILSVSSVVLAKCAVWKDGSSGLVSSHLCGYSLNDLEPCMDFLYNKHRNSPCLGLRYVRGKYTSEKYLKVASMEINHDYCMAVHNVM